MDVTPYRLSKDLGIPKTRISQIIKGKRRITADTALRLSSYFGNSAKFWLSLQNDYDIEEEKINNREFLELISLKGKNMTKDNSRNLPDELNQNLLKT
jgi:addiction module HigA family antidote